MRRAFVASGKANAAEIWTRTQATLELYARGWVAAHRDACEATRVRGEQSEELMDLRMACLNRRLGELSSLTALFSSAEASVVDKAIDAAHALTPLEPCAAGPALANRVPPPADALTRKKVEELRIALARVKELHDAGKYAQGLTAATEAAASARALHYRPVEAEALYALADAQDRQGQYQTAKDNLLQAVTAAEAGGDDRTAARAAVLLSYVVGYELGRHEEGLSWGEVASAKIERLGGDPELSGRLNICLGAVLWDKADYKGAEARFAGAVDGLGRALGPEHPFLAAPLNNRGLIFVALGNYTQAEAEYQRALAIQEKTYGADSAGAVPMIANLGDLYLDEGRPEEAERFHRRALQIYEAEFGKDTPDSAEALKGLGGDLRALGRFDEAESCEKRALALRESASGPNHQLVVGPLTELGAIYVATGRFALAETELQRAVSVFEKAQGPESPDLSEPLAWLGNLRAEQGQPGAALPLHERARAVAEKLVPNHPSVARALTGLGRDRLALGQAAAAVESLDRALLIRESSPTLPADLAETRFYLSRALAASKGDLSRARRLAVAARDTYRGSFHVKELAAAERWVEQLASK
jgi:tetratricopeptide (TPR) repeat protein